MPQGAPPAAPAAPPSRPQAGPKKSVIEGEAVVEPAQPAAPARPPAPTPPPAPAPAPARAPPPRPAPSGPALEEEAERKEREQERAREAEEKAREAEEEAKKAEEEVKRLQQRLKAIAKEKKAAKLAIAAAVAMAVENPAALEAAAEMRNKLKALDEEERAVKGQLNSTKSVARQKRGEARRLRGMAGRLGGAAFGYLEKMKSGPIFAAVFGGFLWFLLNMYNFRTLANWVLVSVITYVMVSIIFKEPKKSLVLFLLPIIIWFLDMLKMLTPANSAVATGFVVAVMLLTFDIARDFVGKALTVGTFVLGGIIIFWMSAWAQMQMGNAYPHIVSTILMFGYFMWMLTRKGNLKWAALLVNFLFFASLFAVPSLFAGRPGSPLRDATDAQLAAWNDMFAKFGLFGRQAYKAVATNYLIGIGDYEEGVEAESQKPLGVFLDNVGVTSQFVAHDGQIDMFARLRAESFKTDEPLNISVTCYEEGDEDKTQEHGTIKPRSKFVVDEYESTDIDCILNAVDLGVGPKRIILDTSFSGFKTSAFLKVYFMEQDRIRAYRRQNPDPAANPLDQFGIADKNPVAVFTGGPLKVGMGVAQQPVALIRPDAEEEGAEFGPTLGITLDRNWFEGELLEVSRIKITAPPGLIIRDVDSQACTSSSTDPQTKEHSCVLEGPVLKSKFFIDKPVKTPKTLRVHTGMDDIESGIAAILVDAPMAIRSFKTEVTFTYRIKKQASVTVRAEAKK
jgi:hypothetical protein